MKHVMYSPKHHGFYAGLQIIQSTGGAVIAPMVVSDPAKAVAYESPEQLADRVYNSILDAGRAADYSEMDWVIMGFVPSTPVVEGVAQ